MDEILTPYLGRSPRKIDHCGAVPRVFLTGCAASSGTRCARLNGGSLSVGSAYVAVDFLCAALESDTQVESLEGPRSSLVCVASFQQGQCLLRLSGIQQYKL